MNFKTFLTEQKTSECEARFGEYLFGELKPFYKKEKEADTPTEKMIFSFVKDFIVGEYDRKGVDSVLIHAFNELKKCQKDYPEVIKPNSKTLYRGIGIDKGDVKNIKDLKPSSKRKIWGDPTSVGVYKYAGRSKVQSWSESFGTAFDFASGPNNMNKIPVVLEYTFSEKALLFNTKFLNSLSKDVGYSQENEIIRIENKPINTKVYILDEHIGDK